MGLESPVTRKRTKENSSVFRRNSIGSVLKAPVRRPPQSRLTRSEPKKLTYASDSFIPFLFRSQKFSPFYKPRRKGSYVSQAFHCHRPLGNGSFGSVGAFISRHDGRIYAIKEVGNFPSKYRFRRTLDEGRTMNKLRFHANIVQFEASWEEDENVYIQMEYCKDNLRNVSKGEAMPEEDAINYFIDCLLALSYMHAEGYLHLDIKPDNLLVSEHDICKLADFGLSVEDVEGKVKDAEDGDSRYLPAEAMWNPAYFAKSSDIFSLAASFVEMVTGLKLQSTGALFENIRKAIMPPELKCVSVELQSILESMMNPVPSERPSAAQLLDHPFLKQKVAARQEYIDKCQKLPDCIYDVPPRVEEDEDEEEPSVPKSSLPSPSVRQEEKPLAPISFNLSDEDEDEDEPLFKRPKISSNGFF